MNSDIIRTKRLKNVQINDKMRLKRGIIMKRRDRKLFILRQLGLESEPIALADLVDKLEFNYNDRTIRRLLNELVKEGLVRKIGHTKGVKYISIKSSTNVQGEGCVPSRVSLDLEKVSSFFGTESLYSIGEVSKPLFERQPVTYNADWFSSYQPNKSFYLSLKLRDQLQKSGQRVNKQDPQGTYAHQIFNRLLIDLSYNSSRLEGNTYSLLETERLLLHGNSAQGKLDQEKVMILNHKEAIRYLVDNAIRLKISFNVICTLHYLLSDGLVESQYAGKVRDYGVRIGGSTYIPFENPNQLQSQLGKIAEKASMIIDPFEQSFFLLVHISYIQAFVDVNKRTARLSANIPLITKNLVPLAFSDVEVKDYMSAMIAIYELQDVCPLIDLYVYSYMRTCAAYDSTVKALGFDEIRVRYRQQRREVIREIILQKIIKAKVQTYIQQETKRMIPEEHQKSFVEDVEEDLMQIDESRIVGLGITSQQLNEWLKLYRN
jgi:Fic family protein